MRPKGRWVHLGSSCSTMFAKGVATSVDSSFGFVWLIQVRPECSWVRFGLSGSCWCALEVAGFVRIRLVRPGAP